MPADKPSHFLPSVGRHTEILEHGAEGSATPYQTGHEQGEGGKVALRRPSSSDAPDLKKLKVETSGDRDASMTDVADRTLGVSPGLSIPSTQEENDEASQDVDIPALDQAASPSFATPAASVPGFQGIGLASTHPVEIDLTKQDQLLEDGKFSLDLDELQGAVANGQDTGAGLLRHLNSDKQGTGLNSHSNSALHSNSPPRPLIHNSGNPMLQARRPLPSTAPVNYAHAPVDMPPWLADIHSGLQSLHSKADRQYAEIQSGLQIHGHRIQHVEAVTAEHSDQHKHTANKIRSLEEKVRELENQRENAPRSPRYAAPRSPRSPRSPRQAHFGLEPDDEPDMDLVIGGWCDARRDDAIEETRNILRDANLLDQAEEIWAPYSRTSFVKCRLIFDKDSTVAMKRKKQTAVLEKLKAKKYVSGIPGSEQVKLWITRSKSPEERRMTRAIVLCKQFYLNIPNSDPTQPNPFTERNIDISWQGKVFIGKYQLLGSINRDGEPGVNDLMLSDARGNHLEWYLLSLPFSAVTGKAPEDLQEVWDKHRPSERE